MKDILVVEDGKKERERLEKLFTTDGYTVLACEGVTEAEKSLERESFRLAILDIGLNDKSGSYLFDTIKKLGKASYIMIFTGNPSVHLKQRFINDGAVDYIVKASPQSQSSELLARVKEIIGPAQQRAVEGIELEEFLDRYLAESSRALFLDMDNSCPECKSCRSKRYVVSFSQKPQVPPEIVGVVICAGCGTAMNPEVE